MAAGHAQAQTATATLFVTVRDEAGAAIPNAKIEVESTTTSLKRNGVTDSTGSLALPVLGAGSYTLRVNRGGFTEFIDEIRLEVGVKVTANITLRVGNTVQFIAVEAPAGRLSPANSTVGYVLNSGIMTRLPLNGRTFTDLTLLTPGAVPTAPGSELSTQNSIGINISGAREASNNFLLDGTDNNDQLMNRAVVIPGIDAIQEFNVLANNYDAEYGRNGGGQINVLTRSGQADLRGSIYEYFRHSSIDARNSLDSVYEQETHLRRNQFGGTLAGPFGSAQNFFFVGAEGLSSIQAETRAADVPTLLEKSGDFSSSPMPIVDPFTGLPFEGNRIPADRIDKSGAALVRMFPDPTSDGTSQFVGSPRGTARGGQLAVKTDHQFSERRPFFLRYTLGDDYQTFPYSVNGSNLPGFGYTVRDRGQNVAFGMSALFSARLLNELRVGFNRLNREVFPANKGADYFSSLGIRGPHLEADVDGGVPSVVLAGYEKLGDDPNIPQVRRTGTIHLSNGLTFQLSRHYLKVGGEMRRYLANGYNHVFSRGQFIFQGALTGNALADLLLGMPTVSILATNDNPHALRTGSYNFFLQDDWKLQPSLTLNLGVRYEYNSPPVDARDRMLIFDRTAGVLVPVGRDGISRSGLKPDQNNVGPRVGFAWSASEDGSTVLRGGYGVFYDVGTLAENSALYYNPPYFSLNLFVTGPELLKLSDPFPSTRGFSPLPTAITLDRDFRTAYVQQWSLGVRRNLGSEITGEVRYVGSKGTGLSMKRNLNQPFPGPGSLNERRPIAGFADIVYIDSSAHSNYHAFQASAERRYLGGVSLVGAYTLSKSIDNASAFASSEGDNNTPQNAADLRAERGLSNFDMRHRFSLALTYDSPARFILIRGWSLSALLRLQSGRPFTPRLSFDNSNTGNVGGFFGHDRPNLIGSPQVDNPTSERFFNTDAFAVPEPYSFGNAGRNILIGPGFASLDMAVSRDLFAGDIHRLQARVEIFNTLNRLNLGLPESFLDRPTFGRVLRAHAARQLQLVLRYSF